MSACEVVITHYKRPQNIAPIVNAIKKQTVDCLITICDVSPDGFQLSADVIKKVDRHFKWNHNFGSFNRFIPMLSYQQPYTLFLDDDHLPGCKVVENYIYWANKVKKLGILGQIGRIVKGEYTFDKMLSAGDMPLEVNVICQSYFYKTTNLQHLHQLMIDTSFDPLLIRHDDLASICAMKRAGLNNYLVPCPDDDCMIYNKKLSEQYALWSREDHLSSRNELFARYRHWLMKMSV